MSRDVNVRDRMVQLAKRLLEGTQEGRTHCSATDREETFLYSGTKTSVKIERFEDREDGESHRVTLLNERGSVVEELSTRTVSNYADGEWQHDHAPWNETVESLFEAARRDALNIDVLLDSVLEDIDKGYSGAPPGKATKQPVDDPWAAAAPVPPKRKTTSAFDDEPPF